MKQKDTSVKFNMLMNMLLTMSNFIFPLITFPYVSRILLPSGTGKIDFALSVVAYFGMFVRLGIPVYGIRACAKVRDNKEELSRVAHELLFINMVMTVVVYIIYGFSLAYVPRLNRELKLFLIAGTTIFLDSIGVEWLYKGLEKYTYITIRSVVFKLVAFVCMFLFVHSQGDYVKYGAISILATSASNILNFINLRKIIYIRNLGGYNYKRHIKMILIFFSMSIATTIYTNLDTVMLGFIKDDTAVGYYGAAVKIKNILMGIVTSASTVLLPRASYYVDKGEMDEFYRILKKTMHFIVLVALSFTVYFILYAKEGIYLLSGKEFGGSIIPMRIIMPTLLLIGITNVTGIQMMVPMGMEKGVLYSEIAGAIVDLILNAILIPVMGVSGAAIGTLVAEIVVMLYQIYAIRDVSINVFEDTPFMKMVIACSIGGVVSFFVKYIGANLFITLMISAICFWSIYLLILILFKDSIIDEIIKTIKSKKKINFKH